MGSLDLSPIETAKGPHYHDHGRIMIMADPIMITADPRQAEAVLRPRVSTGEAG